MSTPTKPSPIAVIRRQPTGSRSTTAATSVTASGSDCMIAERFASGIWVSAIRKVIVAITSPKQRNPISRVSCAPKRSCSPPMTRAIAASAVTVIAPRSSAASKVGMPVVTAFMQVSLKVKVAIATFM